METEGELVDERLPITDTVDDVENEGDNETVVVPDEHAEREDVTDVDT